MRWNKQIAIYLHLKFAMKSLCRRVNIMQSHLIGTFYVFQQITSFWTGARHEVDLRDSIVAFK